MGNAICVIIVNYNKEKYIMECLESLFSSNRHDFDVFVVDNASEDNSVEMIVSKFPMVEIIQTGENIGGSGGFRRGIDEGLKNPEYCFFYLMDNDVKIDRHSLDLLVKALEEHEDIGVAGSAIFSSTEPDKLVRLNGKVDLKRGVAYYPYGGV